MKETTELDSSPTCSECGEMLYTDFLPEDQEFAIPFFKDIEFIIRRWVKVTSCYYCSTEHQRERERVIEDAAYNAGWNECLEREI